MKLVRLERVMRMSIKNLAQYKMRAGLTVLGIVFGVCSVVAMLSVGEGASIEAREQIQRLGSRNILIRSVKLPNEQLSGGQTQSNNSPVLIYGLTYEDARRLSFYVPHIKSITPIKRMRLDVRYKERQVEAEIVATKPWYPQVTNHRMLANRFFSAEDAREKAAVCVVGARLARDLFLPDDPVGKNLRVDEYVLRVVGVIGDVYSTPEFENKPLWFVGENQQVYLPLESFRARAGDLLIKMGSGGGTFEQVELHELILELADEERVMEAAAVVRRVLASRHDRMDYELVVPLQLLQQAKETQRLFNIVLGSIAAISLVVGGIGIMNIMLATVSERTREIGIRRALGAQRHDIVQQFLVETLVLSIMGGVIGMILGAIIPMAVTAMTGVTTVLTPMSFIVAFSVSVAVGLVFGIYPAKRAAQMDPIEALRHE